MRSAENGKAARGKQKPVCPYSSSCYRKNPQHLKLKEMSPPAGHKLKASDENHDDGLTRTTTMA